MRNRTKIKVSTYFQKKSKLKHNICKPVLSQGKILCNIFSLMAIAQSYSSLENRIHISVYSWSLIFYLQVNPNTPTMAYNQQQQQPQQYVVAGQMINIGNQVLEQQPQFVTVDPNAMGSAVGKINFYWIPILADLFYLYS